MVGAVEVSVLGPVSVTIDDRRVALGTPRQRQVVTALALRRGAPVALDTLADLLWDGRPPASYENTLQAHISRLRRAFEPDRTRRTGPGPLRFGPGGYALHNAVLDVVRFEAGIESVQSGLGADRDVTGLLPRLTSERADDLLARLTSALALWRGTPFEELADASEAAAARARLDELRVLALETRAVLEIGLGREATAAADLEGLTAAHPLRERFWALRVLALVRSGRQADALSSLAAARTVLADELGVDPGRELVDLHRRVLEQDPTLGARSRRRSARPLTEPPLVGREQEMRRLIALHDETVTELGGPRFAVITGEPGVGKSRLTREFMSHAAARGTAVLDTRCPQDEGVPALWPWSRLLAAAGVALSTSRRDDTGGQFRAWGDSIDAFVDAAREGPTLAIVDDVHWADPSTLRMLTMLAASERQGHLLVVLTWRSEATARLLDFAATLGRHHALRLELGGIAVSAVAALVAANGATLTDVEVTEWADRTGGNPFFLTEFARLRRDGATSDAVPPGIREVLAQRLSTLAPQAGQIVRVAAVLGREFDVTTVAAVVGCGDDAALDALEAAQAAELVHETGVDRFRFVHDLLRDTARAGVTATRSTRLHAAAAEALCRRGRPGVESEIARHWLSAGPSHAADAWRSARVAAAAARRVHAYDECTLLLRDALEVVVGDRLALDEDRCDLLLELADATRLAGRWSDMRPVVHEALELAQALGDLERTFAAATLPTDGALWLASPYGRVDDVVVAALRRLLADLPHGDDPLRCRVMLSLSSEIYYAASHAELDALVDEAIAMADRLGDERLLLAACLAGSRSLWRPSRSAEQHQLAERAVGLSRRLDDQQALADALTARASASSDLGWTERLADDLDEARSAARAQRLLFDTVVVDSVELGWRTMRGTAVETDLAALARTADLLDLHQSADAVGAVAVMHLLWSGQYEGLVATLLAGQSDDGLPVQSFIAALLGRTGRVDEAVAYVGARDLRLDVEDWLSSAVWSMAAEAAMHTGDRALAAAMYERLAPLAGRPATAGSAIIVGPVDAFLAMAAHTVGESATAVRHADDAGAVATAWAAQPVLQWVQRVRDRVQSGVQA
ncbi:BTAD domain-containing putative transcriptional regulator [Jatrophihabitans sp. YIM 134969]